jgi:hypothetical protein
MPKTLVAVLAIAGSIGTAAFAADREIKVDDRLDASADTLTDMMRASDNDIPQDLLRIGTTQAVVCEAPECRRWKSEYTSTRRNYVRCTR